MPFFFACFFTPGCSAGLPAGFARRWSGTVRRLSQRGPNFLAGQRPHLGRQGHKGGPGRVLRLEAEFFALWSLLFGHCHAGTAAAVHTAADFLCSLSAYFADRYIIIYN